MPMNPRLMRPLAGVPSGTPASLLLHFDGTNGSTSFVDSSPNGLTVTANGDAQISTAQSKWGGASGTFNDTDAYLTLDYTAPLAIGESSAFTVEAWVRPDATQTAGPSGAGNAGAIISTRNAAVYAPYELSIRDDLTLNLLIEDAGSWQIAQQSATALVADEWSHIALVNDNGSLTLYINGVADATITNLAITPYAPAGPLTVYVGAGGDGYFNGYIDDFRIVKWLAVYTSNFTPPTGPLGATVTPQ